MNQINHSRTPRIRLNLIQKLMCLFAILFLMFFLLTGFITQRIIEKQIVSNMETSFSVLIKDRAKSIEEHFRRLENLGKRSAHIIEKWLLRIPSEDELQEFGHKYQYIHGALRTNVNAFPSSDISAIFLSNLNVLNDEIRRIIIATEGYFGEYAKGTMPFVFNMYLITRHQLIRIYEKNWALEIEPDHDFAKDIFYYIADPEHSPDRTAQWTFPYYDSIWKHWMISLITPIYIDDEFFGIVGHDYILDTLYNEILNQKYFNTGYGFIFDVNRNIIVHPGHLKKLHETADMGTELRFSDLGDKEFIRAISEIVENGSPNQLVSIKEFHENGKLNYLFSCKLDLVNWYFGIVVPNDEVVKMLSEFRKSFFFGAIVVSLILFCGVILIIWVYVVSPITALTKVTKEVRKGDLGKKVEVKAHDEIGELGGSFNEMTDKLARTLEDLRKDISERKRAEEALRKSEKNYKQLYEETMKAEEVYRSLLHTSADAILMYDLDGKVSYLSPAFTTLFGWTLEELKGKNLQFLPESERKESMAGILGIIEYGKAIQGFETKRYSKSGRLINVSMSGSRFNDAKGNPAGVLVLIRDTSERTKLESQLHQAQKMEAIGMLAGGVAHDLNNILGGLVSYPELLLLQLPEDSPLRKSILTIQKSGEKAAAVVQDLLTLARRGVVVTEVVNLNDIIAQYLKSPENEKLQSYHPGVYSEAHLGKEILNISGSPIHLSKTVMNLVSNAAEAMPEGGTLTVSTENRYIDMPIRGYDDVKEGDYVVLTVSDTGTGISPDDIKKIFEPFYTKKKMGRSGTGLGMAVVWGTVKDHNGYIDVESTEGKGTTFTLYFPATREELPADKSHLVIGAYSGDGESILVIDDVEEQRNIASGMLKELGYSVVSVSSGEEGVEYLKTNEVDLLVLDMIMDPGMDGLDTYRKILEIHPGQKAIIASGFSETGRVKEVLSLGAGAYIRKPFLLEKMGLAIKEELKK